MTQRETERKILSVQFKTMEASAEYYDSKCKLFVLAPEAGENGGQNERTCSQFSIVCACEILKDRPVCYGTLRLKNRVCAVTRCALLKTPTLKSNKR